MTYRADFATVPAQPTATGTIKNDDGQVLAITSAEVNENAGTANLKITLSPAPSTGETIEVNYQTADGTAVGSANGNNVDYTSISKTSDLFGEDESLKTIQINITDDTVNELQEKFTLVISTTSQDVSIYADGVGTVKINDNDATLPVLGFVELPGNINEGTNASTNTTQNITLSLGTEVIAGREITANYTLSSDNANIPADVKLATTAPGRTSDSTGAITIAKGSGSVDIPVEIIADDYDEDNETFTITLSTPSGATIGTTSITGTIANDDDAPIVSIAERISETETDADFSSNIVVSLDNESGKIVTVPYTVAAGSATTADFILTNGEVVFTPDLTTKLTPLTRNLTYTIKGDNLNEAIEQFTVTLGTPTNGDITGANITGTITITDDDNDLPTLTIADAEGREGSLSSNGSVAFTPTLNSISGRDIVVTYSTTPSGDYPVEAGDYISVTDATITIPAGRTTPLNPISITTIADNAPEPDESFILTYSADFATVPAQPMATGIINNDDEQVLTITSIEVNENVGTANLEIVLSPAPNTGETVEVSYQTINGTAAGSADGTNADFTLVAATPIVFGEGEKSKPIQINISDDSLSEIQEQFTVVVSTTTLGVNIHAGGVGTILINDNDTTLPALGFAPLLGNISEGTNASTNTIHNITVNLGTDVIAGREITTGYTLSSEEAEIPMDVKLASSAPGRTSDTAGTITIAKGASTVNIPVEIIADEFDEDNESFTITLTSPTGATIGTESITGTIADDDDPPTVSIATTASETETDADFTGTIAVSLDRASTKTITVPYTVTPDSATSADFSLVDSEVVFTPNPTTKITPKTLDITYTIKGDQLNEDSEQFMITLGTPTNGDITGANITGTVTIADDDSELPTLTIADAFGSEGSLSSNGSIEFTPTLSTVSGRDIVVTYSTAPSGDFPIETGDYSGATNATITIPAGRTTPETPISIEVIADEDPEPDETFTLTYSADYADVPEQPTAIGTINNDDGQVLTITSAEVDENVGMVNLKMTLSPAPGANEMVSVSYQTVDGTAIGSINGSNADYASITTTTVKFGEGEKSKPIQISISDDTLNELQEKFTVVVTTIASGITTHADGVGTVTINDNDTTLPALGFIALSGNIIEGTNANTNTIRNITVNLGTDVVAGRELSADYTLSSDNAYIPHDIKLATTAPGRTSDTSGVITFAKGTGSVNIPVEIIADEFDEDNETFTIRLANAVNATIGTESITGTIGDDDDSPNINISVTPLNEGNDPLTDTEMVFTVTLDKQSYKDIRVDYRTTNTGTATSGSDFTPILSDSEGVYPFLDFTKRSISNSGVVTNGITSQTFSVLIKGDTLDEENETIYVLLSSPQNATLPPNEVVEIGTITDDDVVPELTISPAGGLEGTANAGAINFNWTLNSVSGREITLDYETASGTAISGEDFFAITKTQLRILAGEASGMISVKTMEDGVNEPDENFTLELSGEKNVSLASASVQGIIQNDDLLISIESEYYPEGTPNATFYLITSVAPISDLVVTYEINYLNAEDGTYVFRQWNELTATILAGSTYVMIEQPAIYKMSLSGQIAGSLNIRLVDGTDYGLGTPVNANIMRAADESRPLVSISQVGSGRIYETKVNLSQQRLARFQLIAQPKPTSDKSITVWVTQEGNYIAEQFTPGRWLEKSIIIEESTGIGILEIAIEDDELDEANGMITATLQKGTGYYVGKFTNQASVNVFDDDGEDTIPEVSITKVSANGVTMENDLTAIEGSMIEVEFSSNVAVRSSTPLIINYDVSIEGDFFGKILTGNSTTMIATGANSSVIQTATIQDDVEEPNGILKIILLSGNGYFLASSLSSDNTKEITIQDDDPTLTINSLSKVEGTGNTNIMRFEVVISSAPLANVTVAYSTSSRSARQNVDFTEAKGTLNFSAHATTSKSIAVTINSDNIDEDDEEFELVLLNPTGGAKIGGTGIAVGTIEDDDDAPTLSINSPKIIEGHTGEKVITFLASLSHASSREVTFGYTTIGKTATAGEDYIAVENENSTIPVGSTSLPINVRVKGDTNNESDETFTIALTIAVNATISSTAGSGIGTIVSDDDPAFHVNNASGLEDPEGEIIFEVTLSPALNLPASVRFNTVSGATDTAISGEDFEAVDIVLNFKVGERSKFVTVELKSDDLDEDDEEFTVRLISQSDGATIVGNGIAKGLIIDNDGEINMSISDTEIAEGNTGEISMEFVVTLDSPSGREVRVRYNTADLTTDDVADDETDYIPVIDGVLIFIPGVTERTLSISIKGDDEFEPDEAYYLVLSEATNATITKNIGIGTILNDDPEIPRIYLENGHKTVYNEGEMIEIRLTVRLLPPKEKIELPINVTQSGDFIRWRIPKVLTMDSNIEMLRIPTIDDAIEERNGSITISIEKKEQEYTVHPSQSSVTVLIHDNDRSEIIPQPNVAVASQVANSLLELLSTPSEEQESTQSTGSLVPSISVVAVNTNVDEGTPVEFDIVSSGTINRKLEVHFSIDQVGDFISEQIPSQVYLTQAESSTRVLIDTIDDTLAEKDGVVTLTLDENNTYHVGKQRVAAVSISDIDDRLRRKKAVAAAGQDVLSDLVGMIGARSIGTTTNRARSAFNTTKLTTKFEINGAKQLTDLLTSSGEMVNADLISLRSILGRSSFTINLFPEDGFSGPAAIWGLGDHRDLSNSSIEDSNSWNGDVFIGQLGFDVKIGSNILAGISTSIVESDINHLGTDADKLMFRSNSTALNPYFGWTTTNQDSQLRGIAGFGSGNIALEQKNYDTEFFTSQYYTFGLSGEHRIYSSDSIFGVGTTELSFSGESWLARQFVTGIADNISDMENSGSHFIVSAIGSHQINLASGTSFKPSVSIGARRDHKNQDSVMGLEFSGGVNFSNSTGLSFSASSSSLMVDYNKIQKWSLNGNLRYDHGGDKLGTLFEITPSIGNVHDDNSNTLWGSDVLDEVSELGQYGDGIVVDSTFGYGFSVLGERGVLTPFGGFGFTNDQFARIDVGTRVLFDSGLKLELESLQQVSATEEKIQEIKISGGISW